jgi:hypothetical protein
MQSFLTEPDGRLTFAQAPLINKKRKSEEVHDEIAERE